MRCCCESCFSTLIYRCQLVQGRNNNEEAERWHTRSSIYVELCSSPIPQRQLRVRADAETRVLQRYAQPWGDFLEVFGEVEAPAGGEWQRHHSRFEPSELADDGDDFLVIEAGPDLAELGALNEPHKNIRGSSGVVRVSGIPVNLGSRDSAGPQVLDSSHFAGDGVVVGDRHGVRNAGDYLRTATSGDDKGQADDIRKILIYGLGCRSTQPVDIENDLPLLVAKSVVVAER